MLQTLNDWLALLTRVVALGGMTYCAITNNAAGVAGFLGLAGLPSILGFHAGARRQVNGEHDRKGDDDAPPPPASEG